MSEFEKKPSSTKATGYKPKRKGCFVEREPGVYLYAHWLSNYPWLIIIITLAIAFTLSAVAFTRPFELDAGGSGFTPRSDEQGIRKDTVLAALDWTYFSPVVDSQLPPFVVQVSNSQPGPGLNMLYTRDAKRVAEDGSTNILYTAAIEEIRRFELLFAQQPNFTDFCFKGPLGVSCLQPLSLTNYFYPPAGQGATISNESVSTVMSEIPEQPLTLLVDKSYRFPSNIATEVSNGLYTFGYPLAGFNNSDNGVDAQDDLYNSWISKQRAFFDEFNRNSSEIDLLWQGQGVTEADTNDLLLGDAKWAIAAIVFVLIWMWIHTVSLWLAVWAMVQIILSFPVAYFFIVIAMNVRAFNTLNMLGIFILLGIGADDAFIMVDRWKQSAFQPGCTSHATRMAFAFKSAAKSMFVTSFTTSISFFINAGSTIAPIRIFGIFVGILILANYVFVITLFPAFVSIWGHYFEDQCCDKKVKQWTKRHPVDLSNNHVETTEGSNIKAKDTGHGEDEEQESIKKMRFIERFFYFKFSRFIAFWRIPILIVLGAFFIGMLVMATRLQPAQEPAEFIPDDYPLAIAFDLQSNAFNSTPRIPTVNLYWGPIGVDRSGTDPNDPEDLGTPIYDPDFDASSPAAQQHLLYVCQQAALEATTLSGEVECPMLEFRNYLISTNRTWPSTNFEPELREFTDWYALNNDVDAYERPDAGFGGIPLSKDFGTTVRFDNVTNQLRMWQIIVNTTIGTDLVAKDLRPFFVEWEAFKDRMNQEAPAGVNMGSQTSTRWTIISTEDALFDAAIFGLWTSLLVALGVLLVLTHNVFLSLITILSIGCIVTCVIGTLVSIGWSLGIIESICLTIVVGLSVDYSAHQGSSYEESRKGKRAGRTRDMLSRVGLSIFSAGLTTVVSACFLIGATILFFQRFGLFIVITVGYSWVFALLAMPAMLHLFGPQMNQGNLFWFCRHKPEWLSEHLDVQEEFPDVKQESEQVDLEKAPPSKGPDIDGDFAEGVVEL